MANSLIPGSPDSSAPSVLRNIQMQIDQQMTLTGPVPGRGPLRTPAKFEDHPGNLKTIPENRYYIGIL